jgi:hypothetical protein
LSDRPTRAGIFIQSMWARNRIGIGYRTGTPGSQATKAGGIHSLELIPELHKRLKIRVQATYSGRIDSLESIPGLLKSFKIRALVSEKIASGSKGWMGGEEGL